MAASAIARTVLALIGLAAPAWGAAPPPAGEPPKNTLKWTTASEVDNFGFDVYRADAADGPFVRLTRRPIPGAGTCDAQRDYRFEDKSIDPTRDYWYYVESISLTGARERFTPVIRAPAKRPATAAAPHGR